MFSMSEAALLANLRHRERVQAGLARRAAPAEASDRPRPGLAARLRALASRLDLPGRAIAPAGSRLTAAK